MQNQTSYDKVNANMIAPISIMFKTKFEDEMIDAFVEDLSKYSAETLMSAFKHLRRTCTRQPKLAEVIQACDAQSPPVGIKTNPKQVPAVCGHLEVVMPGVARQILDTPAGKLALQLGVARDLLITYESTGQKDFPESFVRRQKRSMDEAVSEIGKNKDTAKSLEGLYAAMMQREKRLFDMFSSKISLGN